MLHTMYITYRIMNIEHYNRLYEVLNKNSLKEGYKFYPLENVYKTHYLQHKGFNEIILRKTITKEKYQRPYMQIEILFNPKKTISDDPTKITKDKDIVEISNEFNQIIHEIDSDLPDFFNWTLKRIDYATYIITPYVKEYIKLFQRADIPVYFKELYDNIQNRRIQKDGSFYLYSKSTAINFYDKEKERVVNKDIYNVHDADIARVKNILRIEVQCNKSKTDYLKRKNNFETKEVHNYLTLEESRHQIMCYYKKCIRTGKYYNLNKAKKIIDDNKELSTRTKNKLKTTLDLINQCRSIAKARERFVGTKETFNNHLKKLDDLNINPVTIPERWDIKELNNPINEIVIKMSNEVNE